MRTELKPGPGAWLHIAEGGLTLNGVALPLASLFAVALSVVEDLSGHEIYISAFYLIPIGWERRIAGHRDGGFLLPEVDSTICGLVIQGFRANRTV